jgi:hypothetical protein
LICDFSEFFSLLAFKSDKNYDNRALSTKKISNTIFLEVIHSFKIFYVTFGIERDRAIGNGVRHYFPNIVGNRLAAITWHVKCYYLYIFVKAFINCIGTVLVCTPWKNQ